MSTMLQVLSPEERQRVHEHTLNLLSTRGALVESDTARRLLAEAGALVDGSQRVRFPGRLVEEALRALPSAFILGGRRQGWSFPLGAGLCTLCGDGTAIHFLDLTARARRPGNLDDWRRATQMIDALDEVGLYWTMIDPGVGRGTPLERLQHWRRIFTAFSKHVQDGVETPEDARWLGEVLQIVFGTRDRLSKEPPFSCLVCPRSPLVLPGPETDACLALLEWGVPVAIMPMPLMGATAPASLIATLVQANAEVLAGICMVQAARPGSPCIYAPVPAVVNPRTWRFGGGEVEHALLSAAVTEMARSYGIPVEAFTGGADEPTLGVQASLERALNWSLPVLAWPDILVGPGLLEGSTTLCLEQIVVDVEIFRRCVRMHRGIGTQAAEWMPELVEGFGEGMSLVTHPTTRRALRSGEWYVSRVGSHDTYEHWRARGEGQFLEQVHQEVDRLLAGHEPLPLGEDVDTELDRLEQHVRYETGS